MSLPIRPKRRIIINPMTGNLDTVSDNNFSYDSVPEGKKLIIPSNNQMALFDGISVDGDIDLFGTIVLEE